MFEFVRKHTRVMQVLLFLLIVPSFVLFGLEGYTRFREGGVGVAEVDGRKITQAEWDNAHRVEVERIRQQMPNIDAKLLDSPEAKYASLERLVRDRVVAAAAVKGHLSVTDQRLARELQRNEFLASLRTPDGRLDMQRYRQVLASQGMTPEMYEAQVRNDMTMRQVLAGVQASGMVLAAPAGVALDSFLQRREAQVLRFAPADYQARVKPTDAEVEAFYKANPQLFQAQEQAAIEYMVLDLDAAARTVTLNEQDLKAYFDQNVARLAGQEERRASHILVAVPKGASAEEKAKAKAKAEDLLAQARKKPDAFADLARKNSQDPGSAPQGGDLDFFARGAMTKPFEDAAFALKKGEISGLVETEFGFHIIRLTDLKVPKQRTFEEMRPQIEADLKKQQAQRKYAELAETFTNGVYEQSDSLKPMADKLKLEIRTATVTRQPAADAKGPLANPKFLGALFSPDALERKRNTEAMEVGPSQLVSGRVVQYSPARTRPFDDIKPYVRERLVADRAAELARKEGQEKMAALKAAPAAAPLPAAVVVSRLDAAKQPRQVVDAVLRADPKAFPAVVGVDLGAEGYAIAKVNRIVPRDTQPGPMAEQERQQYAQAWSAAETIAYYNALKERYNVKIEVAKPKGLLGE